MGSSRYDVLVVGAGPAGSIAALVLARAGARVALVDKARFPRDKACGDLVGPRGLQVLADLGVPEPPGLDVGDMVVVGPTGRRVLLPCFDGATYPGRARAVTRTVFDAALRTAALEAGAVEVDGRAADPLWAGNGLDGYRVGREEWRADFVVGADGAASHVAASAGLVDESRVLWGFAVRCYVDQPVDLPVITFWEQRPWRAFSGYGWIFPGPDGAANARTGDRHALGSTGRRRSGAAAARLSRPPGGARPTRPGEPLSPAPTPGRMAQDGDGGDHAGSRPGTAGRGRRRVWSTPCRVRGSPRP